MSRSNSVLWSLFCAAWSLAWSSVAVVKDVAEVCLRALKTRTEDCELQCVNGLKVLMASGSIC